MTPHDHPASALILLALVVTVGYVLTVWTWPFVNCRRCSGAGKTRSFLNRKTHRVCRRCGGTGRQLRRARAIWNFLHRLHNAHPSTSSTTRGRSAKAAARAAERNTPR